MNKNIFYLFFLLNINSTSSLASESGPLINGRSPFQKQEMDQWKETGRVRGTYSYSLASTGRTISIFTTTTIIQRECLKPPMFNLTEHTQTKKFQSPANPNAQRTCRETQNTTLSCTKTLVPFGDCYNSIKTIKSVFAFSPPTSSQQTHTGSDAESLYNRLLEEYSMMQQQFFALHKTREHQETPSTL